MIWKVDWEDAALKDSQIESEDVLNDLNLLEVTNKKKKKNAKSTKKTDDNDIFQSDN